MTTSAEIAAVYYALKSAGQLANRAIGTYRCRHGCLLAQGFQIDGARYLFVPSYKLSLARNEKTSVPRARVRNTTDGVRKWRARGFSLDDLAEWDGVAQIDLRCDHVDTVMLDPRSISAEMGIPGRATRPVLLPRLHD